MKTATFKSLFVATTLALGMGAAGSAFAIAQFQVDPPGALGSYTGAPFFATEINGSSSELLVIAPGGLSVARVSNVAAGNNVTTGGYMSFSGFSNTGPLGPLGPVGPLVSGLGLTYNLYLTFDLVATLTSGVAGGLGSTYNVTSLNFSVFRNDDMATPTTFLPADLLAPPTPRSATITDIGNNDVLLGTGSRIFGLADINGLGGAQLNSTTTYLNTAAGNAFFVAPVPFYTLAFNAFNNQSTGVQRDLTHVAITAAGVVAFNRVPEPATLALLGMGLIGMGVSLRKRKAA